MPQATKNKRPASGARTASGRRGQRQERRCKDIAGAEKKIALPIADSIYSLKLKSLTGTAVCVAAGNPDDYYQGESRASSYRNLYRDLLKVWHAYQAKKGEPTSFDPVAQGALDMGQAVAMFMDSIKRDLSAESYVNVVYNDTLDCFQVFILGVAPCDWAWSAFEIVWVARYLEENPPLRNLYLQMMRRFKYQCNIPGVYNNYATEMLDYCVGDRLFGLEDELRSLEEGSEWYQETLSTINAMRGDLLKYKPGGIAYKLWKEVRGSNPLKGLDMELRLMAFDQSCPLVEFLWELAEFLQHPGCLSDFELEGLGLYYQFSIIYDEDDTITGINREFIDAEATGVGVIAPVLCWELNPEMMQLLPDDWDERRMWIQKLQKLQNKYVLITEKCKQALQKD